jgi:photosystem II stability/assembly factor-like uncharacterized protein
MVWLLAFVLAACGAAQAQWEMENSGTTADLRGIDNVGGGVAWASGTNGTVLRTEDGGYMWQACSIPPGAEHLDFRGIQAFDANTAIVMSSGKGDLSRLYKTTDGCRKWKLILRNPDTEGFWDALYFDQSQRGWLLGDPINGRFAVFYSDDRGRTWLRLRCKGLEAQAAGQGAFAASNSSLAGVYDATEFGTGGGEGAFVYSKTETEICLDECSEEDLARAEQKSVWARGEVPIRSRSESSGIFSLGEKWDLGITNRLTTAIVAVGGDYLKPDDSNNTAAFTLDGGKTWAAAQTPPHGFRSAVAYDAASKTWITVGPNGTDISTDDGRNWRALDPDPAQHEAADADRNWNALSLPFVVGPHGRIGKLNPKALVVGKAGK